MRNLTLALLSILFFPLLLNAQTAELNVFSKKELEEDFDLLVSSLKEAHAGLYWYNSSQQFDSLCRAERASLNDNQTSYDFFRIASRIVTATREGHCRIGSSRDVGNYFNSHVKRLPFTVKYLGSNLYLLNDVEGFTTRGFILKKVNGTPVESIIDTILLSTPNFADGFITSGKIRYSIDHAGFSNYYADFVENTEEYAIEVTNPINNETFIHTVRGVSTKDFNAIAKETRPATFENPIEYREINDISYLGLHSFRHTYYDKDGDEELAFLNFRGQIDSIFNEILQSKAKKMIIDLRNNGGGTEGYEDYILSYLVNQEYKKYRYVQTNTLDYSFLDFTQYDTYEKQVNLRSDLEKEFYLENDGRYLRRAGFMRVEPPKNDIFNGEIYVLISGKTYSGGSELAALLKQLTNAQFVGEETGGGFYGQTSGFSLRLKLPHTQHIISIPIMKFVLDTQTENVPNGRGVIPEYFVEPTIADFLYKTDTELTYTLDLIG